MTFPSLDLIHTLAIASISKWSFWTDSKMFSIPIFYDQQCRGCGEGLTENWSGNCIIYKHDRNDICSNIFVLWIGLCTIFSLVWKYINITDYKIGQRMLKHKQSSVPMYWKNIENIGRPFKVLLRHFIFNKFLYACQQWTKLV